MSTIWLSRRFLGVGLLVLCSLSSPSQSTPPPTAAGLAATFGFLAGEPCTQIVSAVGQSAVLKTDGDIMELSGAPVSDPGFDTFLIVCSKNQGLVKLVATGKDIDDDADGRRMRIEFAKTRDALRSLYGDPSESFDFIKSGSTLKKPDDFMMALTKTDRTLASYWTRKDLGKDITSIALEGDGLGSSKGYLSLEYEFAPYHDYLSSQVKK